MRANKIHKKYEKSHAALTLAIYINAETLAFFNLHIIQTTHPIAHNTYILPNILELLPFRQYVFHLRNIFNGIRRCRGNCSKKNCTIDTSWVIIQCLGKFLPIYIHLRTIVSIFRSKNENLPKLN